MKSLIVGLLGGIGLFITFNVFGFIGVVVLGGIGMVMWIASIGLRALKMSRSRAPR